MVKVEFSASFGRQIRVDSLDTLGQPTGALIAEAIQAHRKDEALMLLDCLQHEDKYVQDMTRDWVWAWSTYVTEKFGEDELFRLYKEAAESLCSSKIEKPIKSLTVEERFRWWIDVFQVLRPGRRQGGGICLSEESDRWVVTLDPCGSGGKLRRKDPLDGTPSRADPPYNCGATTRARSETWGLSGVSHYCTHCAWIAELTGMDVFGMPNFIVEYPVDPEDPCRLIFYKDVSLVPESFYTRMGRRKGNCGEIRTGRSRRQTD